jgi:small-conductance mechanosensitive channel
MEELIRVGQIEYLGNTLLRFCIAASIALILFSLLLFVRRIVRSRYATMRQTERVELLEMPFRIATRTAIAFLLVMSLAAGLATLVLSPSQRTFVSTAAVIALCWQIGLWSSAALVAWLEHRRTHVLAANRAAAGSLNIVAFIGRLLIWLIVLLLTLENLGIDITALIAGLGIGGIAIALAVQNILGDLFASLSITFDKPFVVGDFLIVDAFMGTVENIGIKSTRLRSLTGEQIIMSNADLLASRVRNYQSMRERRIVFALGITYETPHAKVRAVSAMVRAIIESRQDVRFDRCHFARFGSSALEFETVYFVLGPEYNKYMDIQQAINLDIHDAFEREGIEFAYPTQKLWLTGGALQAGDRSPSAPAAAAAGATSG